MTTPVPVSYRSYPQSQTRSPAARRPGPMQAGGPHPQQHPGMPTQHIQARNAAMEHQLAQRRSRKPTDRNMPDGVDECIIGDGVQHYKELRDVERKLDYAMMRKRLDIQDSINRNVKGHKTMRVWISNTMENQPWQARALDENSFDFNSGEDATYRVKIEGRFLDDEKNDLLDGDSDDSGDEDIAGETKTEVSLKPRVPRKRMSHFFKSITIEYDKSKGVPLTDPISQPIKWEKQGNTEFDCIEFERKGDETLNITVNLMRDEQPERYRLSPALASALDMKEADRAEVVMGIWEYVKAMGLQEDEEKRTVRCDECLRQVFGVDTVYFPQIPDRVFPHLLPLPPIKLHYTIRVDPQYHSNPEPTIYDIRVATEDPLRNKLVAVTQNPDYHATLRQMAQLDDSLALIIQAIAHSKAKRSIYKAMSKDPVNFIKKWMSSQKRDLEVIMGEATRGGGEDASGPEFQRGGSNGMWDTPIVREAVRYMLAKPARQTN